MGKNKRKKNIPADIISKDLEKINAKENEKVLFSFDFLDRYHELFNMGDNKNNPLSTEVGWFLDLLDCLNNVSKMSRIEFKENTTYDLHPVNWNGANVGCPENMEQYEFWQFRISKSKGRIIGIFIENCFHIVWLDRYHNLTNSEGYGKEKRFNIPLSLYEIKEIELNRAYDRIRELEEENNAYEDLLGYKEGL